MIRRLWTETEPFDFAGTHVQLTGAFCNPKPVQRPYPPIMIGGRSAPTLRVVAEHADKWNIPGGDIDDVVRRSALLDRYCAEIGRDPASITRSIHLPVAYDQPAVTRAAIAQAIDAGFAAHRPRPGPAVPRRRRPLGRRRSLSARVVISRRARRSRRRRRRRGHRAARRPRERGSGPRCRRRADGALRPARASPTVSALRRRGPARSASGIVVARLVSRSRSSWPGAAARPARPRGSRASRAPGRRARASSSRPRARSATGAWPAAMSRGPSSTRTGTPRSSQSTMRRPTETSVCGSSSARTPARVRSSTRRVACSSTPSPARATSTTTWTGATRGGRRRPWSSPWTMIVAPSSRVEAPHDVCHGRCTLAVLVRVGDVEGVREVLAELVRRAHLQRLAVAHQPFARPRDDRAGELLAVGLAPAPDRDREVALHRRGVGVLEDLQGVRVRLLARGVGGMALLPEELRGAQEQARAQLPAHDVRPLIDLQRQVAVARDPARERGVDDRLGRRAHHRRLRQLLAAADGDDRQLGAEALDVVGLAAQVALGDQQREVGVARAAGLDPVVEAPLQELPDAVRPRADDHRAADRAVLGQLRLGHHVLVPAREVLCLGREHSSHLATMPRSATTIRRAPPAPAAGSNPPWSRL